MAPGIHAWAQPDGSWWLNNAGAVVGEDGALVIDTCASAARTRRFLAALGTATGGVPIQIAVNTHQHGDHTYGNSLLPPTYHALAENLEGFLTQLHPRRLYGLRNVATAHAFADERAR